jgi:hypothetical protein
MNHYGQGQTMRDATRRQALGRAALAVMVLAAVAASAALAAEPPKNEGGDEKGVSVTILGIHATNEKEPHVDPALKAIAEHLKGFKFNSFRLIAKETRSVAFGKTWELAMLEGYARHVQPLEAADDRVKIVAAWIQYVKDKEGKPKPHVREKHVMVIRKGKYLLSGGWKLKTGALLGAVAVE